MDAWSQLAVIAAILFRGVEIPFLYMAGNMVLGERREKATLGDAVKVALATLLVQLALNLTLGQWSLLLAAVVFLAELYFITRFFECGWGGAILVIILSGILAAVVLAILVFLGFYALLGLPNPFSSLII